MTKILTTPTVPTRDDRVPRVTIGYFRARIQSNLYDVVLREFQRSGISKDTLATRLGEELSTISDLLGSPGGWTLDTVSDLLFAISGAEIRCEINYPLREK